MSINIDDIEKITPCQHILSKASDITPVKHLDYIFDAQDVNFKHIFSMYLGKDETNKVMDLGVFPETAKESIFNAVAKKQLSLEIEALTRDETFEVSYQSVSKDPSIR